MGYLKIPNLHSNQDILLFKKCYALEKIHGTSTHISYTPGEPLKFYAGGCKHENFIALFDEISLLALFNEHVGRPCVVFGEGYGGKMQGMSKFYGDKLRFVAFDVKIENEWIDVPKAQAVVTNLGLEFVTWWKVSTDIEVLNHYRDLPSSQGKRNGIENEKSGEGIVLRPLIEVTKNNGARIIAKHKSLNFRETKTQRTIDPEKAKKMENAEAIAEEWVVPMRLEHVLDKLIAENHFEPAIEHTGKIVKAVIADVFIEAGDEIEENKEVRKAIGRLAAKTYHNYLQKKIRENYEI